MAALALAGVEALAVDEIIAGIAAGVRVRRLATGIFGVVVIVGAARFVPVAGVR